AVLTTILAIVIASGVRAPGLVASVWLVPFVLAVSFGLAIPSMPEHYGCGDERDALANTRTVRSNALFRFVLWNNNFHAEHHLYPAVPWHNQPKLHAYLAAGGRHRHLETSYAVWHARMARSLWRERAHAPSATAAAATPPPSS
ncbi:MAG TPA: fatty acid desaturase, partial [Acidimicrobiales bacterium]